MSHISFRTHLREKAGRACLGHFAGDTFCFAAAGFASGQCSGTPPAPPPPHSHACHSFCTYLPAPLALPSACLSCLAPLRASYMPTPFLLLCLLTSVEMLRCLVIVVVLWRVIKIKTSLSHARRAHLSFMASFIKAHIFLSSSHISSLSFDPWQQAHT